MACTAPSIFLFLLLWMFQMISCGFRSLPTKTILWDLLRDSISPSWLVSIKALGDLFYLILQVMLCKFSSLQWQSIVPHSRKPDWSKEYITPEWLKYRSGWTQCIFSLAVRLRYKTGNIVVFFSCCCFNYNYVYWVFPSLPGSLEEKLWN